RKCWGDAVPLGGAGNVFQSGSSRGCATASPSTAPQRATCARSSGQTSDGRLDRERSLACRAACRHGAGDGVGTVVLLRAEAIGTRTHERQVVRCRRAPLGEGGTPCCSSGDLMPSSCGRNQPTTKTRGWPTISFGRSTGVRPPGSSHLGWSWNLRERAERVTWRFTSGCDKSSTTSSPRFTPCTPFRAPQWSFTCPACRPIPRAPASYPPLHPHHTPPPHPPPPPLVTTTTRTVIAALLWRAVPRDLVLLPECGQGGARLVLPRHVPLPKSAGAPRHFVYPAAFPAPPLRAPHDAPPADAPHPAHQRD